MNTNTSHITSQQKNEKKRLDIGLLVNRNKTHRYTVRIYRLIMIFKKSMRVLYISQKKLAQIIGCCRSTVNEAVLWLEAHGFIELEKRASTYTHIYHLGLPVLDHYYQTQLWAVFRMVLAFSLSIFTPSITAASREPTQLIINIKAPTKKEAAMNAKGRRKRVPLASDFAMQADIGLSQRAAPPRVPGRIGGTPLSSPTPSATLVTKPINGNAASCFNNERCPCCVGRYCGYTGIDRWDCTCSDCIDMRRPVANPYSAPRLIKVRSKTLEYTEEDIEDIVRLEVGIESQEWGW